MTLAGRHATLKTTDSDPTVVPPKDKQGSSRYAQHLPFQVFCCESGTHVIDPSQSYYKYRAGSDFFSKAEMVKVRLPDAPCFDSSQVWFCRDSWVMSARDAVEEVDRANDIADAAEASL
ncbi:hypothetical protein VKT23_009298 [Stygiomarasmius scandens]|uniref:Uncharacterized protein n=1 Tax=Marasmiellus scandens TaxID=2682957 RepID=A0ABR1JIB9_9AGAR